MSHQTHFDRLNERKHPVPELVEGPFKLNLASHQIHFDRLNERKHPVPELVEGPFKLNLVSHQIHFDGLNVWNKRLFIIRLPNSLRDHVYEFLPNTCVSS